MGCWCAAISGAAALAGCHFDSGGAATSGSASVGGEEGSSGAGSSGGSDAGTTQSSPSTSASTGVDSGEPAVAQLVIDGEAMVDFEFVALGSAADAKISLRNVGHADATAMDGAVIGTGFGFVGGSYPGDGGTCGASLGAGASCNVVVRFEPASFGPSMGQLLVDYDDGIGGFAQVMAGLQGEGTGESANLLLNGDAEEAGSPPPHWIAAPGGGTDWQTSYETPYEGSSSIWAGLANASDGDVHTLGQRVDLLDWVGYIDGPGLSLRLRGATRGDGASDDPREVQLRCLDSAGTELAAIETETFDGGEWETFELEFVAPEGTRAALVRLRCHHMAGDHCDGYFDALELVASYP
jgi:hypothetical protein